MTWEEPIYWGKGGHEGNGTYDGDSRVRKLKMLVFKEGNVDEWIHRVEWYFAVNGLTEDVRLMASRFCLERKAFSRHKYTDRRNPIRSLRDFKGTIRERFCGKSPWDLSEQFFTLTQEGMVEYWEKFEALAGNLEHYPESVFEGNFMKGLKAEIKAAVKVLRPRDLKEAMELVQLVENQK